MALRNIAIAGATGRLGSVLTEALVASPHGFNITVLVRKGGSSADLPAGVATAPIDYADPSSLVAALRGQDAVISAIYLPDLAQVQAALIDAAVTAGVQRFIPSEFGSDVHNPRTNALPFFAPKVATKNLLTQLAEEGKLSYTIVQTGPFLNMVVAQGFLGVNFQQRKAELFDGGNARFTTTTLASIGTAVVNVLANPDATKNRAVSTSDIVLTQRKLLQLGQQALGSEGWTEVDGGTTAAHEEAALDKLAAGAPMDFGIILALLQSAILREGYGGEFQKLDNELLGIKGLSEEDMVQLIKNTPGLEAK